MVRHVDLAQWLNPAAIARSAVDLNIKLMKWRLVPQLQLRAMKMNKLRSSCSRQLKLLSNFIGANWVGGR